MRAAQSDSEQRLV